MRITHGMIADTSLRNLSANLSRMERYSNQLTSGKRLTKPSDDPVGVAAALSHRATLEQLDQHLKNIDEAVGWLDTTDAALDSVGRSLQRGYELAVTAANDTLGTDDRAAIKNEIDGLLSHALQLANARYGDQYIFSGTKTTTPAYSAATPPTYAGDLNLIQREIAPGADITVNVTGPAPFDPIFAALNDLGSALGTNDIAGIKSAITDLQSAQAGLLGTRAQVGARLNRLEAQRERLLDVQVNVTELRSKAEDTDYTQVMMNFSTAEAVYKAALQTSARSIQPSLMDYLR